MIKNRSYPMVMEAGEGDGEDEKCYQSAERHEIGVEIRALKDSSLDDWHFVVHFKNPESVEVWSECIEALRGAFEREEAQDEKANK